MDSRPQELDTDSRVVLNDLYAQYTHAFDDGRSSDVADLFTEDGEFEIDGLPAVCGRTALTEFVTNSAKSGPKRRHLVSAIRLHSATLDTAVGTAYVSVLAIDESSIRLVTLGNYHDEFALTEGGWRIRKRRYQPTISPTLAGAIIATTTSPGLIPTT